VAKCKGPPREKTSDKGKKEEWGKGHWESHCRGERGGTREKKRGGHENKTPHKKKKKIRKQASRKSGEPDRRRNHVGKYGRRGPCQRRYIVTKTERPKTKKKNAQPQEEMLLGKKLKNATKKRLRIAKV